MKAMACRCWTAMERRSTRSGRVYHYCRQCDLLALDPERRVEVTTSGTTRGTGGPQRRACESP